MKKLIVPGALAALLIVVIAAAAYYGVFSRVTVAEKRVDALNVVFTKHTGDYSTVGPPMDSLYKQLRDREGIATTRGFGLYYDNPRQVEKAKLRSVVGCVLDAADTGKAALLAGKGYRTAVIPASNSVCAEFPMKGMPSIIIGIFKVYPELMRYQKEKNIPQRPIMELYDTPRKKTVYMLHTDINAEWYDSLLR
jgi:hypothetical protein